MQHKAIAWVAIQEVPLEVTAVAVSLMRVVVVVAPEVALVEAQAGDQEVRLVAAQAGD